MNCNSQFAVSAMAACRGHELKTQTERRFAKDSTAVSLTVAAVCFL